MHSEHNYGNVTIGNYQERGSRGYSYTNTSPQGIDVCCEDYELAIRSGHVIVDRRTIWHSKGAHFYVRLARRAFWRRAFPGFEVRELP